MSWHVCWFILKIFFTCQEVRYTVVCKNLWFAFQPKTLFKFVWLFKFSSKLSLLTLNPATQNPSVETETSHADYLAIQGIIALYPYIHVCIAEHEIVYLYCIQNFSTWPLKLWQHHFTADAASDKWGGNKHARQTHKTETETLEEQCDSVMFLCTTTHLMKCRCFL